MEKKSVKNSVLLFLLTLLLGVIQIAAVSCVNLHAASQLA